MVLALEFWTPPFHFLTNASANLLVLVENLVWPHNSASSVTWRPRELRSPKWSQNHLKMIPKRSQNDDQAVQAKPGLKVQRIYTCRYLYIYMYIHAYTCINMYMHVYTCRYMYMHVYTCIYMYMHVYTCIYMYMHVYTCVYMYMHVYTCICMYIHVYACIYMHIHV